MHPALYPDTILGRLLRLPLRAIPRGAVSARTAGPIAAEPMVQPQSFR